MIGHLSASGKGSRGAATLPAQWFLAISRPLDSTVEMGVLSTLKQLLMESREQPEKKRSLSGGVTVNPWCPRCSTVEYIY
jgi:hypothetical protein